MEFTAHGQIIIHFELHGDMMKMASNIGGELHTIYFALDEREAERAKKDIEAAKDMRPDWVDDKGRMN